MVLPASCFRPHCTSSLPFLLPTLELPVEAIDSHERIINRSLDEDPELDLVPAKLGGNSLQYLWKFLQDFCGNVLVGSRDLCFGDHPMRVK